MIQNMVDRIEGYPSYPYDRDPLRNPAYRATLTDGYIRDQYVDNLVDLKRLEALKIGAEVITAISGIRFIQTRKALLVPILIVSILMDKVCGSIIKQISEENGYLHQERLQRLSNVI